MRPDYIGYEEETQIGRGWRTREAGGKTDEVMRADVLEHDSPVCSSAGVATGTDLILYRIDAIRSRRWRPIWRRRPVSA